MSLFTRYPASSADIVGAAAQILGAASLVDGVSQGVRSSVASAESAVSGVIAAPVGAAPGPVTATAGVIKGGARFCSGALCLFSEAVSAYDTGIGRLNAQWDAFPPVTDPEKQRPGNCCWRGCAASRRSWSSASTTAPHGWPPCSTGGRTLRTSARWSAVT